MMLFYISFLISIHFALSQLVSQQDLQKQNLQRHGDDIYVLVLLLHNYAILECTLMVRECKRMFQKSVNPRYLHLLYPARNLNIIITIVIVIVAVMLDSVMNSRTIITIAGIMVQTIEMVEIKQRKCEDRYLQLVYDHLEDYDDDEVNSSPYYNQTHLLTCILFRITIFLIKFTKKVYVAVEVVHLVANSNLHMECYFKNLQELTDMDAGCMPHE